MKMAVSYNGLWKLLIDKNLKKTDLIDQLGISSSTLAKMSKGEIVSLGILEKICEKLCLLWHRLWRQGLDSTI